MLTIGFVTDKNLLKELYMRLSLDEEIAGANFVLYEDGSSRGLFRVRLTGRTAICDRIRFESGVEAGDREFFFRAMLFKLCEGSPVELRIEGCRPELEIFGFAHSDGYMSVMTDKIELHGGCGAVKDTK